jgi:uncharacterized membrane protein
MSSYPLLDAFLTILWFALLSLWIVILIVVILEIFHNRDIGGWGKAGWLILVILLPLIGVLAYVIVYGHRMGMGRARHGYGADTPTGMRANELSRLTELRARGTISDAEFQRSKEQLLG